MGQTGGTVLAAAPSKVNPVCPEPAGRPSTFPHAVTQSRSHGCLFVHGLLCANVTAQLRADGSTSRNAAGPGGQGQGQVQGQGPATGIINSNRTEQAAPTAYSTPAVSTPRSPTASASFSLHGTLMSCRTTAGVCVRCSVQHAPAHACCTLTHQGAVGLRVVGAGVTCVWALLCSRSTPPWDGPQFVSRSVTLSISQSVSQAWQQGSRAGSACRVARNVQPTCPPALPQCCPAGGVSGCLGCLENFSETPGHPVCFGLCSTHQTPSAHPHRTTPHHTTLRPSPPTVQHACMYMRALPPLVPWPGCLAAIALGPIVAWSLLRDKASPAVVPLGEVPRPRRALVVLAVS